MSFSFEATIHLLGVSNCVMDLIELLLKKFNKDLHLMNVKNKMGDINLLSCRFSSFPEALYQIVTLETVMLGNNQVGGVDPSRLMQLLSLSTLDLSNNDLLSVPPELGLCTSLR